MKHDLSTVPYTELIKKLMGRCTECIVGVKLLSANEPEYHWKGYEGFCGAMCCELGDILQPEEQYDDPIEN